ncbi:MULTISPECIES: pyridoxamine 5'-phosphate oxidase family protein [Nocardia]|uniref:pyridoxamine 5'-phosphate oxidase family protein n=1 Tax=Nocardia TaxID=1817 RepID=UPI000BF02215|nr:MULTISPECIES: pyridoxamine 5'-phosphate oxidase family protein [Nocardia]MBF6185517.1 pyridoxamine 5'-phosphate oxidase family protein [Nocardia farcinica]MBF6311362.1 pyridoxamine 5'-phosphate oxidase family protein [Nocardia farcinica]MBF6407984.1 pyridoxamine 5'-phosphate oxidase family protein [Nocardia farcinica]PEH76876.1 pyridoxamine 5-phosphate oxidase [Nocardia sp. FDAARGOS_372]UEX21364.1 pyridoxamine 5'-phosphate oxidase family protein [Nocardia farcinica]
MTPFHPGELAVQRRLGQDGIAAKVGRTIRADIPPVAAEFLAAQPMVVVAAADAGGRLWASGLVGEPGFVRVIDDSSMTLATRPADGDPLAGPLAGPASIGMIALQPSRRRRMRVNGRSAPHGAELAITVDQVYANCPKYISRRAVVDHRRDGVTTPRRGSALDVAQQAMIAAADTFFVASADPDGHVDASHRGGNPGFLRVLSPTRLRWPDYRGNSMFMTLGNLAAYPRCGLLVPDWTTGGALQLTGTAALNWDASTFAPGSQCSIDFTVDEVVAWPHGPLRWGPAELSPVNP